MENFKEGPEGGEEWQAFTGSYSVRTVKRILLDFRDYGPSVQDRNVLYIGVTKS